VGIDKNFANNFAELPLRRNNPMSICYRNPNGSFVNYGWCRYAGDTWYTHKRLDHVFRPSVVIYAADAQGGRIDGVANLYDGEGQTNRMIFPHRKRGNILLVDQHVESKSFNECKITLPNWRAWGTDRFYYFYSR